MLLSPVEKCNALAEQFAKNHQNPLGDFNASHTRFVNTTVNRYIANCTQINPVETNVEEIKQCVNRLKPSKAPGFSFYLVVSFETNYVVCSTIIGRNSQHPH